MEHFDDMINRSLASDAPETRFPFREEYWLQAQALIEADEQRRRKWRWLFWWFGGGSVLLLIALCCWSGFSTIAGQYSSAASWSATPATGNAASSASATIQPSNTAATVANTANAQQAYNSTNIHPQPDSKQAGAGLQNTINQSNNLTAIHPKTTAKGDLETTKSNVPDAVLMVSMPTTTPAAVPNTTASNPLQSVAFQNQMINPPSDNINADNLIPNAVPVAPVMEEQVWRIPFQLLPLRPTTVRSVQPVPTIRQPAALPMAMHTPPAPTDKFKPASRFIWGATAGIGSTLTNISGQSLNYSAGLTAGYTLNRWLSVGADLQAHWMPGGISLAVSSDTLGTGSINPESDGLLIEDLVIEQVYSFGYKSKTSAIRESGALWLEMPVFAEAKYHQVGFRVGLLPQLLMRVRKTKAVSWDSQVSDATLSNRSSDAWSSAGNSTLNRTNLGYWLGLTWQPSRRFALESRMIWRPNAAPSAYSFTADNIQPISTNGNWAELRGIYYFSK